MTDEVMTGENPAGDARLARAILDRPYKVEEAGVGGYFVRGNGTRMWFQEKEPAGRACQLANSAYVVGHIAGQRDKFVKLANAKGGDNER